MENLSDLSLLNTSLKNLARFLPGHIYWKDQKGAFLGCNNAQAESAGYTVDEMIGKTDYDMPWKAQADDIRKADIGIMRSNLPKLVEETSALANGQFCYFLSNKVPLLNEEGACIGILGISLDITEQKNKEKHLEKQIAETKLTLNTIMESIPAHIYWKDKNCILLGCNFLQAENFGFNSPKEMIGKNNYEILRNTKTSEKLVKKEGDAITKADQEVINNKITLTVEEPLILPNGKKVIYLSKKTPLYNEIGEVIGILGVSFDITREKEARDREIQYRLDGMSAVSTSIAHEIRTPLASLELATAGLEKYLPTLLEGYEKAEEAGLIERTISSQKMGVLKSSISRMRSEIRSAFMFIDMLLIKLRTSVSAKSSETFKMSSCIEEVLKRYPFQPGEKDSVSVDTVNDFTVQGAELLVTHVFFNLIKNALYHMAKVSKGKISILLETDKEYNKVIFRDTGSGIPKEIVSKIFKRFFSKTYHGAGVGLTFCKNVMKSLGGNITCSSEEGEYTAFVLFFPKISEDKS
ncbi:MAG: PAS domain-containing sensor histidine kinase [Gammaproteobacteria bacterium]